MPLSYRPVHRLGGMPMIEWSDRPLKNIVVTANIGNIRAC
jgi:hypothetical protein